MGVIITWLLQTAIGRGVAIGAGALLLSGVLYAGCQVKSCIRAKEELREYHRADAIRKEDPKVDKRMEENKKRVDGLSTPADLDREFDRLQNYGGK
jgi:hypothetical protein